MWRLAPVVVVLFVVSVPVAEHYPGGYCVQASGARVTSAPGAAEVDLENGVSAVDASVTIVPGRC